ncbi:MAG: hypothetical protein HDR88_06820 [Bacteroides sp.]|nr:hypothetical protein [Bacteroides sp.]
MNKFFRILVTLMALVMVMPAVAEGLGGEWKGDLQIAPQMKLKLVFHISEPGEETVVTLDSPDQGAFGIPTVVNHLSNDSINVSVNEINLNFTGNLKDGKIEGTLNQNGMSLPMILEMESVDEVSDRSFPITKEDLKIFKKKPVDITFA